MGRILKFSEHEMFNSLNESEDTSSVLYSEYNDFISEEVFESGNFTKGSDAILNTLSKSLFGSFSKVGMIDQTIEKIYKMKADLIDQGYAVDKEFDKIDVNLRNLRSNDASSDVIRSARKQKEAKSNELKALERKTSLEIERGMKLLSDIISNNKRRQEYADAALAQAEVNLADYEYRKAKREGNANSKRLSEIAKRIEDRKKDLEDQKEDIKKLIDKDNAQAKKLPNPNPKMKILKAGKTA
jgi:hypothetical protein